MGRTVYRDAKLVFKSLRLHERICYLSGQKFLRGFFERWQMEAPICPNAASHSGSGYLTKELKRSEPKDQSRNHITGFDGENWYRGNFLNCITGRIVICDVSDLLTTFGNRGMTQFQKLVQGGKLRLKILSQRAFGVTRNVALRQIKPESCYRSHDQHHRRGKF